ncbi:uncharacterized protein LOC135955107 [Calliphora vicina]|uniref:uncharacterized protein LOC135955107 n=1 Tax=Calliphora vicina TaxID=7373 RepID=UPI00325B807F
MECLLVEDIVKTELIECSFQQNEPPFLVQSPVGSDAGKKFKRKQKSYRKKVESVWMHDDVKKLIEEVERRRGLWDVGCAEYKFPKDLLWQEVADSIPVSFNDCKGKWSNLRTTFNSNLLKLRRNMSGQGADEQLQITWRYFKSMMFLETEMFESRFQSNELPFLDQSPKQSDAAKKTRRKKKSYRKKVESVWTHKDIMKLIEEVKGRRSLWDVGCAEYKLPKENLWQEVADSIPVSINDCKGKWANIRITFNRNLQKLQRKESGQGADEEFQIAWRYFKPMMFLETTKIRHDTESISTMQVKSEITDESIADEFGFSDELTSISSCPFGNKRSRNSTPTISSTPSSNVDIKEMAFEAPLSLPSAYTQSKDASTALGEYIAAELRNLPPEQASFARAKLRRSLNDILDEAALMVPQHQNQQ